MTRRQIAAAALAAGSLLFVTHAWAERDENRRGMSMKIGRKADMKTVEGPAEYFTGKVTIAGQFQRPEPSRVSGAIVRFEAGARTAWHMHPAGQTLFVMEGAGWTQIEGGPKLELHAGDIVWCPADHKHWHGATPDSAMTHIAIQESVNGSPVKWMEKVSDEQYLQPVS